MDALVPRRFQFEGFTLDTKNRFLNGSGGEIELRPKSFDVLAYLVLHHGELVTKDELIHSVWQNVATTDESLTRCVSDIRAALNDVDRRTIKTIPGKGYLFAAPVQETLGRGSTLSAEVPSHRANWWPVRAGAIAAAVVIVAVGTWVGTNLLGPSNRSSLPDRPSIAVLPFASFGGAGVAHLGHGIARSISNGLSRFGDLFVVAPNSTARFGSEKIDPAVVGGRLRARYLLVGYIRLERPRLLISVQLVVAESGRQIWSETYDRPAADVAGIEAMVVKKVVGNLVARITQSEYQRLARKTPPSWTAYDSYLRGNALMRRAPKDRTGGVVSAARAAYQKALMEDASYAPALEGLALTYWTGWLKPLKAAELRGEFRNPKTIARAEALARRSVDSDPRRASAWAALGWIQHWRHGPNAGLAAFERAFRVNPNFVDGRYAMLLTHAGRSKEAIAYMTRAMRFDPLYPLRYEYYLGLAYFFAGEAERSLPLLEKVARGLRGFPTGSPVLAAAAASAGDMGKARSAAAATRRLWPRFSSIRFTRFLRLARQKDVELMRNGLMKAGLPE
jgi:adenylate cyclase